MSQSVIYKAAGSGLANRLRALVGYQALSHFLEVPFRLCWVPDAACDTGFSALFETELTTIKADAIPADDPANRVYDRLIWFHDVWREHLSDRVPFSNFVPVVRVYLNQLVPVRSIRDLVNEFASTHRLEDALGVHIRHTDNVRNYESWTHVSPGFDSRRISSLSGFAAAIESQLRSGPVFLATDNRQIEESCESRYGAQLLMRPKRYTSDRLRTSTIEDALIEMLLLGRCREILGTYYSSFSKFSAIWGNTGYREVIGTECERNVLVDGVVNGKQKPLPH